MNNFKEKISKAFSSRTIMVATAFVGLYLISSGTSWAIFSYLRSEPGSAAKDLGDPRSKISLDLPRTQECPVNGGMFTEIERDIWEKRRPLAVVLENHVDSRPVSGISKADVVYEAVAEGGITRFLAVYYCGAAAEDVKVAPVRSARVYYIDFASEYGDKPIFMHVGGANNYSGFGDTAKDARALELLETLGWRVAKGNDLDTTYDSGFPVFWRNYERLDHPVATEHTMMVSLDAAYEEAERRGYGAKDSTGSSWDENFTPWKFKDESPSPSATNISFEFWSGKSDYDVTWRYDAGSNQYFRVNGGKDFIDLTSGERVAAKNVVIQFARERGPVDRNLHMLYTTIGEGRALIFQNGEVSEATWEKSSRSARTRFFDAKGSEVPFVRGAIWIEIVPAGNEVDY